MPDKVPAVHSIARHFSAQVRRMAAYAPYTYRAEIDAYRAAWNQDDRSEMWCPVGIMLTESGILAPATPGWAAASKALRKPDDAELIAEFRHFMRNFDDGKYQGILPEILGVGHGNPQRVRVR